MIKYFCPGSMNGKSRLLFTGEPVTSEREYNNRLKFKASGTLAIVFEEFIYSTPILSIKKQPKDVNM
jgi:hypothetical protein